MGRIATSQLAELASITDADHVLDGSGIGGTARFLAGHYGCRVTAIDLTEEYCDTARWLNQLSGLDDLITARQGDVTSLPFVDATFQVVISQHVQMNVPGKARLHSEARRVLAPGGRLAIWTSPRARRESSAIRCPGPTGPNSATSPALPSCALSSNPPGSPSRTGPISPARRPSSCRRCWRGPPTR